MAVDIDQNVYAIGRDAAGRFVIAQIADVDPMFDGGFDAVRQRAVRLRTAVIGEYLDAAPVVQFEQLRHQIADGMIAQVGGNIADARPPAAQIDFGMPAVILSVMRAVPGVPLDVAIGGGEL